MIAIWGRFSSPEGVNPFSTKECFADNDHNPDVNFYHDVSTLDTQNLMPDNFKDFSEKPFFPTYI